jgi:hypothetical protein
VPDHEHLVDVTVPKNRAHKKAPFRLSLDHARASFSEVPVEVEIGRQLNETGQVVEDAAAVRLLLLERPGLHGHREIVAEFRARGVALGRTRLDAAVARLGGEIERRKDGKEVCWFIRSAALRGGHDDVA